MDASPRISRLRRHMIDDMRMRNLSEKTQTHYLRRVQRFAACLRRSPDPDGSGFASSEGCSVPIVAGGDPFPDERLRAQSQRTCSPVASASKKAQYKAIGTGRPTSVPMRYERNRMPDIASA